MLWLPLLTFTFVTVAGLALAELLRDRLAPTLAGPTVTSGPSVTVLIPARNEAARIAPLLAGLAQQRYQPLEVIVVDDQSSDGTAALVRTFSGQIPGLQLLDGAPLPPGWAGKPWACWQGVQAARGDWLLFLDADVVPRPDLVGALVGRVLQDWTDLITLMPQHTLGSSAERLLLPAFHAVLYGLYPLHRVGHGGPAFANGQVLFISRTRYAASGGHQAVANSVLEDVTLGQRAAASGAQLLAAHAPALCSVRMYSGWKDLAEGLGKNAVAGARSGGRRATLVGARLLAQVAAPLNLIGWGGWTLLQTPGPFGVGLLLHGIGLLLLVSGVWGAIGQRRYGLSWWYGLLFPVGVAAYFALAALALVRVRGGRGVRWKDRWLPG